MNNSHPRLKSPGPLPRSAGSDGAAGAVPAEEWTGLLEQRTGLTLTPERRAVLLGGLAARMRAIGCDNGHDYYRLLCSASHRAAWEWTHLFNRITVRETRFFRHPPSFELIRRTVDGWAGAGAAGGWRVWSVGCASGQEAYSLAMILDEARAANGTSPYFAVTGVDISSASLTIARRGVYGRDGLKGLDTARARRYLAVWDQDEGAYRICDGLRRRVCFAQLNLWDAGWFDAGMMDIIFCQNLLLYFNEDRRRALVARMVRRLAPDGLLVLGPGELRGPAPEGLIRIPGTDTLAFRRCAGAHGGGF